MVSGFEISSFSSNSTPVASFHFTNLFILKTKMITWFILSCVSIFAQTVPNCPLPATTSCLIQNAQYTLMGTIVDKSQLGDRLRVIFYIFIRRFVLNVFFLRFRTYLATVLELLNLLSPLTAIIPADAPTT